MADGSRFMQVPIDQIDPGPNVRDEEAGELNTLVESIRQHGVLQPITIVPTEDGRHVECLFGHRRLAAARLAGLTTIPCRAVPRADTATRILTQLAENRDRRAMTALEEARAIAGLKRAGMTQAKIAAAVGMSSVRVGNCLQLLRLPESVQRAVHQRKIKIEDAVCIPVELARETDPRTLAAVTRRGGHGVRAWVADQIEHHEKQGRTIEHRRSHEVVNLDGTLMARVRTAATKARVSPAQWVTDAIKARLAGEGMQA